MVPNLDIILSLTSGFPYSYVADPAHSFPSMNDADCAVASHLLSTIHGGTACGRVYASEG